MRIAVGMVILALLVLLPGFSVAAGHSVVELRRNPFVHRQIHRPDLPSAAGRGAESNGAEFGPEDIELRSTLVAGDGSLANLNGVIMAPGEVIGRYRLVQVHEDEVVLMRDGRKIVVPAAGNK